LTFTSYLRLLATAVVFLFQLPVSEAQLRPTVTVDRSFIHDGQGRGGFQGADNIIYSALNMGKGRVLFGGGFTNYNGVEVHRLGLSLDDGTVDPTFRPGSGADAEIFVTALQMDGRILVAGNFERYDGVKNGRIARLMPDGSLDKTFRAPTGANGSVFAMVQQADGRIIIAGDFQEFDGHDAVRIARLNTDGSLDTTFHTGRGFNLPVFSVDIDGEGRILCGGEFTTYDGRPKRRVTRLMPDGRPDGTFNSGSGTNYDVFTVNAQSNGTIMLCGDFSSYNGTSRNGVARLMDDGTLDASFNPGRGTDFEVHSCVTQDDGQIIIWGDFTKYDGVPITRIARINHDGSLDVRFNPGKGTDNLIWTALIQDDGRVVIAGEFQEFDGIPHGFMARLRVQTTATF
jgi:uncharacterized delta-60 repeat protein